MLLNFPRTLALTLPLLLLLSACGSTPKIAQKQLKLEPLPGIVKDPTDMQLHKDIKISLAELEAPSVSKYEYRRLDLDSDGRRDALVLFKAPYGFWCGMHGCTMMVMKAHNEGFTLVNAIQPIRPPLYVSNKETNGWKDIIARVSGRRDEAKDVEIVYDGNGYPTNPDRLEPAAGVEIELENRVFID